MKEAVVKARAKLGKTPDDKDMLRLLNMSTLDEKVSYLNDKFGYMLNTDDLIIIERQIKDIYKRQLNSLSHFLTSHYKEFFLKYTSKFEIKWIEDIIQSIFHDTLSENIADLKENPFSCDIKITDEMTFDELLLKLKNTRYYRCLLPFAKNKIEDDSTIFLISNTLEKFYYRELFDSLKNFNRSEQKIIKNFIAKKVDLVNLMNLYRFIKFYNLNPAENFNYMIEGGKNIGTRLLKKLSVLNLDEFVKEIENTRYKIIFNNLSSEVHLNHSYEEFESRLVDENLKQYDSEFLKVLAAIDTIEKQLTNVLRILELDTESSRDMSSIFLMKG
ncbi:MAG: V-type ATPase subunit [Tissierellia bacterium]|nr:V-type ATPase subunit [Tissierellia bacterium]